MTRLLLLTLLFPSLAYGVTIKDLVDRDGRYYEKFSDVPFTGKVTGEIQSSFKDGKLDGLWVRYYVNGGLLDKGSYKNGKMEGPWVSYYSNGRLRSKGTYKNGERDGPHISYLPDGNVNHLFTGTFKNGLKVSD